MEIEVKSLAITIYRIRNKLKMERIVPISGREELAALTVEVQQLKREVHELTVDVKSLSRQANMGAGGLKVLLALGAILTAVWSFFQVFTLKN